MGPRRLLVYAGLSGDEHVDVAGDGRTGVDTLHRVCSRGAGGVIAAPGGTILRDLRVARVWPRAAADVATLDDDDDCSELDDLTRDMAIGTPDSRPAGDQPPALPASSIRHRPEVQRRVLARHARVIDRTSHCDERPMVSVPEGGSGRDNEPPSQKAVRRGSFPPARRSAVRSVLPSRRSVPSASRSREDMTLLVITAYPVGPMTRRICTYLAEVCAN
jgi:hypothetical protein